MKKRDGIFLVVLVIVSLLLVVHLNNKSSSLEKKNKELRTEIKNLKETLDIVNETKKKPRRNRDLNDTSRGIYVPPLMKYSLKVGDEFPSLGPTAQQGVVERGQIKGSFDTVDEFQDILADKDWVVTVTFEPGGSSTRGQHTYSSPTGATIHVDANRKITTIEGTVYRY